MTKKKTATKPSTPAPAAKAAKPAKASQKEAKRASDDPVAAARAAEANGSDAEEVDEDEAAAAGSSSGGGNAAALAAAGSGEMSASFKNFRHHPDMENFYRFIHENDLRHEALAILNTLRRERTAGKAAEKASKKPTARR